MKTFNASIARIKNPTTKTYEPLDAIKGDSIYDIAVRHGYAGTEQEMIEQIMSDGWVATCARLDEEKASIEYVDAKVAGLTDWKILAEDTFNNETASIIDRTLVLDDDLRNYHEFYILWSLGSNVSDHEITVEISIEDTLYDIDLLFFSHDSSPNSYVATTIRQITTLSDSGVLISPCHGHSASSDYAANIAIPAAYSPITTFHFVTTNDARIIQSNGIKFIVVAR